MGLVLLALLAAVPHSASAAAPIVQAYAGPITAGSDCLPDGSGATPSTQAGSHADFCLAYSQQNGAPEADDLKQLIVDTPTGFAGATKGRPECSDAQFAVETGAQVTCPAGAQVGAGSADLTLKVSNTGGSLPLYGVGGRVFNMTPSGSEVARLGLVLDPPGNPKVKLLIHITLRPAPDVGLRSTINDLPQKVCLNNPAPANCNNDISTDAFALTFWGDPADHPAMPAPFAVLGTDCTSPQKVRLSGVSYAGDATEFSTTPYQLTDCATTPFSPSLAFSTTESRPDVPSAASVTASFGTGTASRAASLPSSTVVTLPKGVELAAQIAGGPDGLPICSAAGFGANTVAPANCPAGSAVGTVKITSPLIDRTLDGRAFIGPQPAVGELPDLYIEAAVSTAADAPRIKLVGHLKVDDQNRLVTTISSIPQVPFSEFKLSFRGGSNAALVTPATCTTSAATMVSTPLNGGAAQTNEDPYAINTECDAVNGFAPLVGFAGANLKAGANADFTTGIQRPDRSARIASTVINLPPGQIANLTGVPECPQDVAARGACDESTRVGSVQADAGVGPAPYRLRGAVYLTNRSAGAVAGISIHTQVKIGDVDLGSLDVPASIEIRPEDLGLRIRANVPERFKGLPLDLQTLIVSLDRPGFARNPTSCVRTTSTSTLTSHSGQTATADSSYAVNDCDELAFAPTVQAAVTGDTKPKGRPTVQFKIDNAGTNAALRSTAITLPAGVGVDLVQLPRACPQDTFRAGGCPEIAKIGTISGTLAITDEPLAGSVYLLKPAPGTVLPGLGLDFTGRFAGRVVGANAVDPKTGRLISKFETIPDLPLTSLQVQINGGTGGPLIATEELCTQVTTFETALVGQNYKKASSTNRTVCGAPLGTKLPALSGRISGLRKGTPVIRLKTTGDATKLIKRAELTLPKGWALASQKGKTKGTRYAKVSGLSLKASASVTRRSSRVLRLNLPSKGTSKLTLLTRTKTVAVKKSSDRKTKAKLGFTLKLAYTDGKSVSVPVLLTPR